MSDSSNRANRWLLPALVVAATTIAAAIALATIFYFFFAVKAVIS